MSQSPCVSNRAVHRHKQQLNGKVWERLLCTRRKARTTRARGEKREQRGRKPAQCAPMRRKKVGPPSSLFPFAAIIITSLENRTGTLTGGGLSHCAQLTGRASTGEGSGPCLQYDRAQWRRVSIGGSESGKGWWFAEAGGGTSMAFSSSFFHSSEGEGGTGYRHSQMSGKTERGSARPLAGRHNEKEENK